MGYGKDLAAGAPSGPVAVTFPEIIAHRGANREARENTLAAFQRALALGVGGIELDVQLSADGVPVVHHDPGLRSGEAIASLTAAEARMLEEIPELEEVLELVDARCRVYIEIKAATAVEGVVRLVATRRSWCAVHSFDHRSVLRAMELDRRLESGILLVSYLVDSVAAMKAAHARDLWQQADLVDADLVTQVHAAGGRLIAWTVNDISRARVLSVLGVDGICTDTPAEIREGLTAAN